MNTTNNSAAQAEVSTTKSTVQSVGSTTESSYHGPAAPLPGEASNRPGVELALGLLLICHVAVVLLIPFKFVTFLETVGQKFTRFTISAYRVTRKLGGTRSTNPTNPTQRNLNEEV